MRTTANSIKAKVLACLFLLLALANPALAQTEAKTAEGLYRQIRFTDSLISTEQQAIIQKGGFPLLFPEPGTNMEKSLELSKELDTLVKKGDSSAMFYAGLLKNEFADKLSNSVSSSDGTRRWASEEYAKALELFKAAGNAGLVNGYWNAAILYENGQGVPQSKLAASEWFYKAGQGYIKVGDRERALASLEVIQKLDKTSALAKRLEAALRKGAPN